MLSQIGTGAAALMAIRVLLDHGVQGEPPWLHLLISVKLTPFPFAEHHIVFLSFLVAAPGIATIERAFPRVRIVASTVGDKLTEQTFEVSDHAILGHAAGDGDYVARNSKPSDDMRYSRDVGGRTERSREKIAWVIEPGKAGEGDCGGFRR